MSKTIATANLHLEEGMIFTDYEVLANHIGYTGSKKPWYIRRHLGHYCKYHYDFPPKEIKLWIDEVFDEVIPFAGREYKYNVGEIITNKFGSIKVLKKTTLSVWDKQKQKYTNNSAYVCTCLEHKNEFTILQQSILRQHSGCPICGRRRATEENMLATDEVACSYLADKSDAYKYSVRSNKKILCECPKCHAQKMVAVINLTAHGFKCDQCGDGFSYPNKFVYAFLEQVGVKHIAEKSFDWAKDKYYDQYLPIQSTIIENHGLQHYRDASMFRLTFEGQQENDKLKRKLALQNGIEHYIELDCRYSNLDWIKNSIMNSELPNLLNFTEKDIDWETCSQVASASIRYEVCKMWDATEDIDAIMEKFHVSATTVRTYIHDGAKCGMCHEYIDRKDLVKEGKFKKKYNPCSPIYSVTDDIYFEDKYSVAKYYEPIIGQKFVLESIGTCIRCGCNYRGIKLEYCTRKEFAKKVEQAKSDQNIIIVLADAV